MPKQKTKGRGSPPPKKKTRVYQAILALAVVGAVTSIYFWGGRGSPSGGDGASDLLNQTELGSTNPALRNRLILPATPRNPRPITLPPEMFTEPEVRQSYLAAKEAPEVLETVACYCGCFRDSGHRNNLDCFKDNHGIT